MAVGFNTKVWFWVKIILVVIVLLIVFRLMFVNRPQPAVLLEQKITYTTGSIVNSVVEVNPGEYVSYQMNLNKRWRFKGNFSASEVKRPIGVMVVDKDNFEKYKKGEDFKSTISTGSVPAGRVDQEIQAGEYFLVFDGKRVVEKPASLNANFYLE